MNTDLSRLRKVKENDVIVKEGELYTEMYKIVSGKAVVYINYGKEDEYLLGALSEQQCFGETTILCKKPSSYTVVAFSDMLLMRITEDEFADFIMNNSRNALELIRNLARQVTNLRCNLDMVMQEISKDRNGEVVNVHELKQRMYQSIKSDAQGEPWFSVRI